MQKRNPDLLVRRARQKIQPTCFGVLSPSSKKLSMAAFMLMEAGELYRSNRQPQQAISSYLLSADCYHRLNRQGEELNVLEIAGKLSQHFDHEEALDIYQSIIRIHAANQQWRHMAKAYLEMGSIYEKRQEHYYAIDHYQNVLDLHIGEDAQMSSLILQAQHKIVNIYITMREYADAGDYLVNILNNNRDGALLCYSIEKYLLTIVLCRIATGNGHLARLAIERSNQNHAFAKKCQAKLLDQIIDGLEEGDPELVQGAITVFANLYHLNPVQERLIEHIGQIIPL